MKPTRNSKNYVPGLQIGDDGGLQDSSLLTIIRNRAGDQLGQAPGEIAQAPPPSI